jgi:hypothetical protein
MNQLKAGVVRSFDPGLPPEARSPDADARRSGFKCSQHLVMPHVPEGQLVAWKGVLGGFEEL